jgi:pimeloyl-ACP methyl ester carboxylesterase
MSDLHNEMRFLPSDAARVGHQGELPKVTRVSTEVSDGRHVSALSFSPEQPPKFVFVHGMGLNAHGYDPVILALGVPAVSVDLPGHGRSDWRDDGDYRPQTLAPDVLRAVDRLAPEPFVLVGHSLGGLTAAAAAPDLARRLLGLVLVDVTPGVRPQRNAGAISEFIAGQRDFGSHEEMVDRAIAFGIGSNRESLTRGVALNTRQRTDGRWEWAHHFAHLEVAPADRYGDEAPFEPLWAPIEALHHQGTPVCLIRGADGMINDELLTEWQTRLPKTETVTIAGPHNLHEASPVELADALRQLEKDVTFTGARLSAAHDPRSTE